MGVHWPLLCSRLVRVAWYYIKLRLGFTGIGIGFHIIGVRFTGIRIWFTDELLGRATWIAADSLFWRESKESIPLIMEALVCCRPGQWTSMGKCKQRAFSQVDYWNSCISDDRLRDEIYFVPHYLYSLVPKSLVNFYCKAVSKKAQGYNFFSSIK